MRVETIIYNKATRAVTIDRGDTVAMAVHMLAASGVGALVAVDKSGAVAGILSERDLVVGLVRHGPALPRLPVARIMSTPVVTVRPDLPAGEALDLMRRQGIGHLPVVHGERLVGIVSRGDLVADRLAQLESENQALRRNHAGKMVRTAA